MQFFKRQLSRFDVQKSARTGYTNQMQAALYWAFRRNVPGVPAGAIEPPPPPPAGAALLFEDGSRILLEDGSGVLLLG